MCRTEEVFAAVCRIQDLEAQRQRVLVPLDAELTAARERLDVLLGNKRQVRHDTPVTATILSALRKNPTATPAELAVRAYERDDAAHRHRIRSLMFSLKRRGRIIPLPTGGWQVADATEAKM